MNGDEKLTSLEQNKSGFGNITYRSKFIEL